MGEALAEEQNGLSENLRVDENSGSASAEDFQSNNHNDSVKMNGQTHHDREIKIKRKHPFRANFGKRFRLLFKPWKWRKKGARRAHSLSKHRSGM